MPKTHVLACLLAGSCLACVVGCTGFHRAGLDSEMQDLCDKVGQRVSLDTWERPESWIGWTAEQL